MTDQRKLEAMLVHLLQETDSAGRPWIAMTVAGYPRFTRQDVQNEVDQIRRARYTNWLTKISEIFKKISLDKS